MRTPWIPDRQRERALRRNEAFWEGELEETPLLWITVPNAAAGTPPHAPPTDEEQWTDVDYVIAKTEDALSRTHYAGDALPVFNPWLGPDQFAAWLGGPLAFSTADNTSWTKAFVENWADFSDLRIDPANRWWVKYQEILHASVEQGRDKWVTGYPDLHTGIDALAAIRGPERLMIDVLSEPESIKRAMGQVTRLWKQVVDTVSEIVLPTGQGTTNWTYGWSRKRFVCVGQNDFTCLIGPDMFDEFVLEDTTACAEHVDRTIYHLDGPSALQHVPRLLRIEALHCIQWIQGAGKPYPASWTDLLNRIQAAGKTVQVWYATPFTGTAAFLRELDVLCSELDPLRLFVAAEVPTVEQAELAMRRVEEACRQARARPR
jgi:hypothetical protein